MCNGNLDHFRGRHSAETVLQSNPHRTDYRPFVWADGLEGSGRKCRRWLARRGQQKLNYGVGRPRQGCACIAIARLGEMPVGAGCLNHHPLVSTAGERAPSHCED